MSDEQTKGRRIVKKVVTEEIQTDGDQIDVQSLRDRIKGFEDLKIEIVEVPIWGNMKIEMRSMTGLDRMTIFSKGAKDDGQWDTAEVFPLMVCRTAYDPETGKRIFEDKDVEWITTKSSEAFERLVGAAMKVNGMSNDSVKEAEGNL